MALKKTLPIGKTNLILRTLLIITLAFPLVMYAGISHAANPIRFGLTPTIPYEQYQLLEDWRLYLEEKLGKPVEFIWRENYLETMEMLRQEQLDYAWICDYPFVYFKDQIKLLSVPTYNGRPYYKSYLIVPSAEPNITSINDLEGKIFAYTDPYSNTGHLRPRYLISELGKNPATFFKKSFFTYSHSKSIKAVAKGIAQGGAVSSHVWDSALINHPEIANATRIIAVSPEYAFPPVVSRKSVDPKEFESLQNALLNMASEIEGRKILKRLNIDGFITGEPQLYAAVEKMMKALNDI